MSWSPAAIYPGLRPGDRFVLSAAWPARAQVLAADGTALSSPAAIAKSGSLALLTGNVVAATAAQAKKLGPPYKAGDKIGQGGIEQAYQRQLAGRPSLTIRIDGPGGRGAATAARLPAVAGKPVRTSIDMRTQQAASRPCPPRRRPSRSTSWRSSRPPARSLAVVERPGGFDRALDGHLPARVHLQDRHRVRLGRKGLRPSSTVQCPGQVTIGGRDVPQRQQRATGHHDPADRLRGVLQHHVRLAHLAAAERCLARLDGGAPSGSTPIPPWASPRRSAGSPPRGTSRWTWRPTPSARAPDLVNPLSQASVVAAIEDGTWRPPQLVISPAPRQAAQPHKLSSAILDTLRPMMHAVVTIGTAAGVGFPPGVYGKTGTAQYGSGPNPPSHGWFIGYRGDLAFAVLVEGGGIGADSAGPIANAFLRKL